MKRVLFSLIALSAVAVSAQTEVAQTGTPAVLNVKGKSIKVFLQRLDGESITFQPFKSPKDMTVPASKIASIKFVPKYDAEATVTAFNNGDYDTVLATLEPLMKDFAQYMPIENNMQDAFVKMVDSYRGKGDFANLKKYASILLGNANKVLDDKAKVSLALAAIAENNFPEAEKIASELDSEAAKLYLKATAQREQGQAKEAILTVNEIIFEHGNDMDWLPQSELLNAYLYLEMTGTNSVITTNSAMNTARQVKNMYGGSNVAADARKFWAGLGGEAIENAEIEARAAKAAAEEAKEKEWEEADRARRKAEAEARKKAKAEKKAADTAAENTDVTKTETESE